MHSVFHGVLGPCGVGTASPACGQRAYVESAKSRDGSSLQGHEGSSVLYESNSGRGGQCDRHAHAHARTRT
eukprot:COSAG03_NODE_6213_length_1095_cov_1.137412_2_plen_70_part_01